MSNPFSGIVSSALRTTYKNMVDALLETSACGRTCKIYYGVTRYETCPDCSANPIGKKPSNAFIGGGYAPVGNTTSGCPTCGGTGKRGIESTEDVTMCVFYDYKRFMPMATVFTVGQDHFAQTLCHISLFPKLKNANYALLDTAIAGYSTPKFQRMGDPEPLGIGGSDYILTLWKRM